MKLDAEIIIPVYNSERTLPRLLESLNHQTFKRFGVIIIDDGSHDNSEKIIKDYNLKFPLKLIKQANSGPAVARNHGAMEARADILIFIDSDCVPKKNFVEEILKPFRKKDIVGVQGEYETLNKNHLIARYVGYEIFYRHERMKKIAGIDHIATYACAYRRKDFGAGFLKIFKKANMEDTELSYRLASAGKRLVFYPKAIVAHPHPSKLIKYLKQQYSRGYWRAYGHKNHQDKLIKDSYMGSDMFIQGSLSLFFMISVILSIGLSILTKSFITFIFPILFLIILGVVNMPLAVYCSKYEPKMIFIAPFLASARSIFGTLGFLIGNMHYLGRFK